MSGMRFAGFSIAESLCASGKPGEAQKEDRLVITPDFVAVIDGATGGAAINGVAGGIVAAEAVAKAVAECPAEATARQFADLASKQMVDSMGDLPERVLRPPVASAVVWSRARNEVWRIGDCHFRIGDTEYKGAKLVDTLAYGFRCAVVKGQLALGLETVAALRAVPVLESAFAPMMAVQHAFLNLDSDDPLAYGAIDGRFVPDRHIEIVPVGDAGQIVLASDGFLTPAATLAEGLAALAHVREYDPLCIELTSGSRAFPVGGDYFDDTTYVRIMPG